MRYILEHFNMSYKASNHFTQNLTSVKDAESVNETNISSNILPLELWSFFTSCANIEETTFILNLYFLLKPRSQERWQTSLVMCIV